MHGWMIIRRELLVTFQADRRRECKRRRSGIWEVRSFLFCLARICVDAIGRSYHAAGGKENRRAQHCCISTAHAFWFFDLCLRFFACACMPAYLRRKWLSSKHTCIWGKKQLHRLVLQERSWENQLTNETIYPLAIWSRNVLDARRTGTRADADRGHVIR